MCQELLRRRRGCYHYRRTPYLETRFVFLRWFDTQSIRQSDLLAFLPLKQLWFQTEYSLQKTSYRLIGCCLLGSNHPLNTIRTHLDCRKRVLHLCTYPLSKLQSWHISYRLPQTETVVQCLVVWVSRWLRYGVCSARFVWLKPLRIYRWRQAVVMSFGRSISTSQVMIAVMRHHRHRCQPRSSPMPFTKAKFKLKKQGNLPD
jgi:hypothetical protein